MPSDSPLSKRIKRHVIAQAHDFYAVLAPGLVDLGLEALAGLLRTEALREKEKGGVLFHGRLEDGWRANLLLRHATRILLRLGSFKAENFRELAQKTAAFPWELYLYADSPLECRVTARHSRLYHTRAVGGRLLEAIRERLVTGEASPHPPAFAQTVLARAVDDRFVISLDTSGDPLYMRGIKAHPARAPLRETLAAAALDRGGFNPEEPLIDAMCGSGTFALEAAMRMKGIPPGWFRRFAFMEWPGFPAKRWEYLKRESGRGIFPLDRPRVVALDQDAAACRLLEETARHHGLDDAIAFENGDFFAFHPGKVGQRPGLITVNPPYGLRLDTTAESRALYPKVIHHLQTAYRGWKVALVVPEKEIALRTPFASAVHPFFHGGLTIWLVTGRIA